MKTLHIKQEHYKSMLVISDDFNATCRIFIYDDDPKTAIITDLYVNESMRKNKKATQIIDYAITIAKENGCEAIELKSNEDNWIREWYKRLGFKIVSQEVWMRKTLNI